MRIDTPTGPAVLSIFIDDTERLAAEEALRRSEGLLSHVVATSPDVITLTDLETGRYVMVNASFERLSGWRADEVVGRTSLDMGIWADPAERRAFIAEVKARGLATDLPMRFVARDGHDIPLRVSAARFAMEGHDYLVISGRDVSTTQREQLERDAILANASVGIAVTQHRRFVLSNPHFDQLYGWAPGELLGQPGSVVWAGDEDYAALGREVGPTLARGEAIAFQRQARRKDGSSFLAFVRGRAVDPRRPAEGGTVWIIEDITERHAAQQALAAARAAAEAANRAKSAFLANTSHELRTPLNGMIGLARLAQDTRTAEAQRRQYLDQIVESAQSLAGIISDILDLSKIEAGRLQLETTSFDLGALLRTLQRTYSTLAEARGLTLTLQTPPALPGPPRGGARGAARRRGPRPPWRSSRWAWPAATRCGCARCSATSSPTRSSSPPSAVWRGARAAWTRPAPAARRRRCASRCRTAAPASPPRRRRGCSSPSRRPTRAPRANSAARAWACRSAVSWPR